MTPKEGQHVVAFTSTSRGHEYDNGGYTGLSTGEDVLTGTTHHLARKVWAY